MQSLTLLREKQPLADHMFNLYHLLLDADVFMHLKTDGKEVEYHKQLYSISQVIRFKTQ